MSNTSGQSTGAAQMEASSSSHTVFDSEAPYFVGKGIIFSAVTGAAVGGIAGYQYNVDPTRAAAETSQKWLAMGTAFFATREYIVSPFLLQIGASRAHLRRRQALSEKQRGKLPEEDLTLSEVRHNRVLDSALTGGLTFGVYSYFTRGGLKIVPRAALTAGLAAGAAQYAVNFSRLARIRLLASGTDDDLDSNIEQASSPNFAQQMKESTEHPFSKSVENVPADQTIGARMMNLMTYVAPIKKISREEAYQTLLRQKADLDKRLESIEQEENMLYETAQRTFEQRRASSMQRVSTA